MRFITFILTLFSIQFLSANTNPTGSIQDQALQALIDQRTNAGKGCFNTMLEGTAQGIDATLQAQNNMVNQLMGISKQYMENEQRCGNDLAEVMMEMTNAEADHEERLMQLPSQIELKKLEYEEALLAVKQDCERTSGADFLAWKQQVSTGVVTADRGGIQALVGRDQNIARYQKLFYDDCLAQENNLKRVDILARKLNANIQILQAGIDSSAMKLASLSQNLSFKQGVIVENCQRAEAQLDYQSTLTRNMASATQSATKTKNFLNMLNSVNVCLGGPANSLPNIDVTGASSNTSN